MDDILSHINNLEKKMAILSDKMDRQEKILEKMATVIESQLVMKEQISNLKESVNIAFGKIRDIETTGISLCSGHAKHINEIEKRISTLETRAWQIWLAVFTQFIALIITYIKF